MFNPAMLLQMLTGQTTPIGDISGITGAMAANPAIQGPAATPVTPGPTGSMQGDFLNPPGMSWNGNPQGTMPGQGGVPTPPSQGPSQGAAPTAGGPQNQQQNSLLGPTDKVFQMAAFLSALSGNPMGEAALEGFSNLQANRMNTQMLQKRQDENGLPFPGSPQQAGQSNSPYQDRLVEILTNNPGALRTLSPEAILQAWGLADSLDRSLTSAAQQAFQNKIAEQELALTTLSTANQLATGDVSRKATLQDMDLAKKREGRDVRDQQLQEEEHRKRMAAFDQTFEANQRALDDQIRQSVQQITIEKTYASIAGMPYEEGEARARLQTQRNLKTGSPEDAVKMVDRVAMYIDVYLDAHKDLYDPALRQLQQNISLDVPQTNEFMLMSPEEQAQALRARKLNMTSYIERMKTHPAVQRAVALAKAEIDAGAEPNTASMAEMRNLTLQAQTAAAGTPGKETGADKGAALTATQLEGMIGAETAKKKVEPQGSSYPSTKMEGRSSYSAPSAPDPFAAHISPNTIQGSPKPMDISYVFDLLRGGVLSIGLMVQKIMDLPPEAQEETLRLLKISHKDFMAMPEDQRKAYLQGRLEAVKGE